VSDVSLPGNISSAHNCVEDGMSIKSILWKPHEKKLAIKMAHEGKRMKEIAVAVGRSRNSVIGFLHRSLIPVKKEPVIHKPVDKKPLKFRPKRVPTPYKPSVSYLAPEDFDKPKVFLFDTKMFECKWIYDKPENVFKTTACGQPTEKGSYCPYHHNIVYQPRGQANAA